MIKYIDVRSAWPLLVIGNYAISLEGCARTITVDEALVWLELQRIEQEKRAENEYKG